MDSSNSLSDLPPRIVGISGRAGSGKDTCGSILCNYGYTRYSFATPLKAALTAMGFPEPLTQEFKEVKIPSIDRTWRHLAQTLGTEWGRQLVHPDLWVICAAHFFSEKGPHEFFVITDVRFENEAALIRKMGGIVVHLIGREHPTGNDEHASEQGINVLPGDATIANTGTLEELRNNLRIVCNLT